MIGNDFWRYRYIILVAILLSILMFFSAIVFFSPNKKYASRKSLIHKEKQTRNGPYAPDWKKPVRSPNGPAAPKGAQK